GRSPCRGHARDERTGFPSGSPVFIIHWFYRTVLAHPPGDPLLLEPPQSLGAGFIQLSCPCFLPCAVCGPQGRRTLPCRCRGNRLEASHRARETQAGGPESEASILSL